MDEESQNEELEGWSKPYKIQDSRWLRCFSKIGSKGCYIRIRKGGLNLESIG